MNKLILSTLLITVAAAPSSWAKKSTREAAIWAKVTHVQPITQMIEQYIPQKHCWNEPIRYKQPKAHRQNNSGAIIGTIVGGAIGNNISRHGRSGTIIGAVIGASVGHNLTKQNNPRPRPNSFHRNQRRCQMTERVSYQEKVIGYDVSYRYQGNEYQTQMDHHPGRKIRVKMSVQPF